MKNKRDVTGSELRSAFLKAMNDIPGPFNLSGRGHEERCTFNRSLAAYLRGLDIPHVYIAGFGANNHYPSKLVNRAAEIVNKSLGWETIKSFQGTFYVVKLKEL